MGSTCKSQCENETSSNRERERQRGSWMSASPINNDTKRFAHTSRLTWDGHFSFAWESVVHRPCVRRPPRDLLHDLGLLHPLQLRHVRHDASATGLQALRRLQRLVFLGAGGQQLTGPVAHPDLMVDLLLDVAVLRVQKEKAQTMTHLKEDVIREVLWERLMKDVTSLTDNDTQKRAFGVKWRKRGLEETRREWKVCSNFKGLSWIHQQGVSESTRECHCSVACVCAWVCVTERCNAQHSNIWPFALLPTSPPPHWADTEMLNHLVQTYLLHTHTHTHTHTHGEQPVSSERIKNEAVKHRKPAAQMRDPRHRKCTHL